MARPLTLWIAIVDGEHARFVQPDQENALRTVRSLDSASAHLRSRDIGTDRPGRSFESAGSARHGVGERQDPHEMEKDRFVRLVADELNEAAAYSDFDELVLAAPPRALHELRAGLDDGTEKKVIGTLEKDLVKTPDGELWPHLQQWVGRVERRVG